MNGLQGYGDVVDSGDHDDGHVGVAFFGAFQKGNAIHFGHHQVREDEIELVA